VCVCVVHKRYGRTLRGRALIQLRPKQANMSCRSAFQPGWQPVNLWHF